MAELTGMTEHCPGHKTYLACGGMADYAAVPCEDPDHYRNGRHL